MNQKEIKSLSFLSHLSGHLIFLYSRLLESNIIGQYFYGLLKIVEGIQLISIALNYFALEYPQFPLITSLTKYLDVFFIQLSFIYSLEYVVLIEFIFTIILIIFVIFAFLCIIVQTNQNTSSKENKIIYQILGIGMIITEYILFAPIFFLAESSFFCNYFDINKVALCQLSRFILTMQHNYLMGFICLLYHHSNLSILNFIWKYFLLSQFFSSYKHSLGQLFLLFQVVSINFENYNIYFKIYRSKFEISISNFNSPHYLICNWNWNYAI